MLVRYEIEYWNDVNQEHANENGFASAGESETIGEIVNRIYNYYGEENVISLKVTELNNIITDEEIHEMFN